MRGWAGGASALLAWAIGPAMAAAEPAVPAPVALLADLGDEVRAALDAKAKGSGATDSPAELLDRIFEAAPAYRFDAGIVSAFTDRRWFATMPPDDPAAPLLELRRWPGDTVLAFYGLVGETPPEGGPSIPGARLSPASTEAGAWSWKGTLGTALGERPILWIERSVPDAPRRLGALLAPGDAGFGLEAIPDLLREMLAVVARVEVRAEAWRLVDGIAPGTPIALPTFDPPPADADECKDVWQVVEANGFTLGLPPGVRARRLDQGVPPPRPIPGGALWIRGRFLDREGIKVAIGDGIRAGYVSLLGGVDRTWLEGGAPPVGAPSAVRLGSEDYSLACDDTGALAARAERWGEPGFGGVWRVFRLFFSGGGVEIGLPVLGPQPSEALFWIPATWRDASVPPAPPPVDPAERFGIAFDQFTKLEKKKRPWSEGILTVPGLRVELPGGWIPITTLRSSHGFPVNLVNRDGIVVGHVERLEPASPELVSPEKSGWLPTKKASRRGRSTAFRRTDGARLYLTTEGGVAFIPERGRGTGAEWQRMADTATLLRPPSKSASRPGG